MSLDQIVMPRQFTTLLESLKDLSPSTALTLYCHNGHSVSGRVLQYHSESHTLLIDVTRTPPEEIIFLPLSSISHFHLFNPLPSMRLLSNGKVARDPREKGPGMLELKRLAASLFEKVKPPVEILWRDDLSETARSNLRDFFVSLEKALTNINSDEFGRKELEKLSRVLIQESPGTDLTIQTKDQSLSISADWDKLVLSANPEAINNLIQKVL